MNAIDTLFQHRMSGCTIVVEPIPGGYRARCDLWPDCEAVAPTEEEARQAVERAIEEILQRGQEENRPQMNTDEHR